MSTVATAIGLAAAVCTTAANLPQLKKAWVTGQTDDLSLSSLKCCVDSSWRSGSSLPAPSESKETAELMFQTRDVPLLALSRHRGRR
jgi:hypothetical protein